MSPLRWSVLLLIGLTAPLGAGAQPLWTAQPSGPSVSVEWLRPSLVPEGTSRLSSAVFLSGRFIFARNVRLVGELPVAHLGLEEAGRTTRYTDVGNPYVGFELLLPDAPVWIEAGVRVSILDDEPGAGLAGAAADFHRLEAFLGDVLALQALGNYRYEGGPLTVRLRVGPSALLDTGARTDQTDVFLLYSSQGWYDAGAVRLGAGLTGRFLLNAEALGFGERIFNQATLAALADFDPFFPGLVVRAPLDADLRDLFDVVVGLQLTVGLN